MLGCTHYPFAQQVLQPLVGDAVQLIETGEPVARQTRRLLEAGGLLRVQGPQGLGAAAGKVTLLTTGEQVQLAAAAQRWLGFETHLL